jgi:uncharacterized protein (DUF2147 family)
MKRRAGSLAALIAMMAISSSAQAGSYSFVIGGHRIHVDAPRNCRSTSCVSVFASGLFERKRERKDDGDAMPVAAATPPAPVVAAVPQPACPAAAPIKPAAPIVAAPPPLAAPVLAAASAPQVAPPPLPKREPPETPRAEPPASAAPPVAMFEVISQVISQAIAVSRDSDHEPADAALGTWEAAGGKGLVRIARCGAALCGYALDQVSSPSGDSVLVNMRPTSAIAWTGNAYRSDSGNTRHATMTLTGRGRLHVETCALLRFFCSGEDWTRIEEAPSQLLTNSRRPGVALRS